MNALLARWRATPLRTRALAFLGVLTVYLLGMAGCEHMARQTGAEIVLKTRPVDPREILRGAYVALDYEVERVHLPDLPTPADPSDWKPGDRLYLTLRNEGGVWTPVALSPRRQRAAAGDVVVRATYLRREDYAGVTEPGKNMPVDILIDIGADHYYADKARAKALGEAARQGPLEIVLSVGGDGRAVIKGLIVDGRRQDERLF
jgi:uncharacterized membrane-anchored protein